MLRHFKDGRFVATVVAVLIAWPVLGERPTWLQAVGAVLIIAGVLVTRRK